MKTLNSKAFISNILTSDHSWVALLLAVMPVLVYWAYVDQSLPSIALGIFAAKGIELSLKKLFMAVSEKL